MESFDCSNTGEPGNGEKEVPENGQPPCFIAPGSLYDGRMFPRLGRGDDQVRPPPGNLGTKPAECGKRPRRCD